MTRHISKIATLALMLILLTSCILGCTPSSAVTATPSITSSAAPTLTIASSATPTPSIASSATPEEPDFPAVDRGFTTESTNLEQIGIDAATYYYTQFMADDIPQYWHITKYEVLSSKLMAGNEDEFVLWIESYIETDGRGFLIGVGSPYDPEDLSKGGICPEVGSQFRIKALGDGEYEIVSIGTGGGTQGLDSLEYGTITTYELTRLNEGKAISSTLTLVGETAGIAQDIVNDYLIKSATWPGTDTNLLDVCYQIHVIHGNDTAVDYYAYRLDGQAVMQRGPDGDYSHIADVLYQELVELVQSSTTFTGDADKS